MCVYIYITSLIDRAPSLSFLYLSLSYRFGRKWSVSVAHADSSWKQFHPRWRGLKLHRIAFRERYTVYLHDRSSFLHTWENKLQKWMLINEGFLFYAMRRMNKYRIVDRLRNKNWKKSSIMMIVREDILIFNRCFFLLKYCYWLTISVRLFIDINILCIYYNYISRKKIIKNCKKLSFRLKDSTR